MGLEDYTTEELKAELKRRKQNIKRETPKIIYKELIGIVDIVYQHRKGIWYYEYRLKDVVHKENNEPFKGYVTFKLSQKYFDRTNLPQVGDKVLLKYKRTKVNLNYEVFDIARAKIYKIIK